MIRSIRKNSALSQYARLSRRRLAGGLLVVVALIVGIWIRSLVWLHAPEVREPGDITNGFNWGRLVFMQSRVAQGQGPTDLGPVSWLAFFKGYVGFYDHVVHTRSGWYGLDYPPMRLLVMSTWYRWVEHGHPGAAVYREDYSPPLLWMNVGFEIVSASLVFAIVRHWRRQRETFISAGSLQCPAGPDSRGASNGGGNGIAVSAALLFWFNPSDLVDCHLWPQWDIWIVPFYLGAILCGSKGRWLAVGSLMALGAMFKGQLLFVAPIFFLWPLAMGRLLDASRVAIGFCASIAVVTSVWMIRGWPAWLWVVGLVLLAMLRLSHTASLLAAKRIAIIAVVVIWLFWPAVISEHARRVGPALFLISPILGFWISRRHLQLRVATVFSLSVLAAFVWSMGSWSWARVGFAFGLHTYNHMGFGQSMNVASLLANLFGWQQRDVVFTIGSFGIHKPLRIEMRTALVVAFAAGLVLCATAAARQTKRNSPRLLIALSTPWLLLFALLPQMTHRYLFWAAAVSVLPLAFSRWFLITHLLLVTISTLLMLSNMGGGIGALARDVLSSTSIAPALLLLGTAFIWLYAALRRPKHPAERLDTRLVQ